MDHLNPVPAQPLPVPRIPEAAPVREMPARQTPSGAPGPAVALQGGQQSLDDLVRELNRTMEIINTAISFTIDEATGKTVIKVTEAGSDKIIRQIPAEDMLRIAARLNDLLGLLVDQTR